MVVHCKLSKFDVYIGRPTIWGNPFSHKSGTLAEVKVSTAFEAVARYREWLHSNPKLVALAKKKLKGKVLGCWCKTEANPNAPCHGDVLAEVANSCEKDVENSNAQ